MQDHIFRKYDIRGIVGEELALDQIYTFGRALAWYLVQRNPNLKTVAVVRDGRVHSSAIRDDLVRALCDSGLQVLDGGVGPTPVLYFGMHTLACDAGVMITASHNEKEYNGFKICFGHDLIGADEILALRDCFKKRRELFLEKQYTVTHVNLVEQYIAWFATAFKHLQNSLISAVVDCGHGAAAAVLPGLVKRMNWPNVTLLYATVDGDFPHRSPDPTKVGSLQELSRLVTEQKASCGIAFDGDADRMVAMTEAGAVLTGDIMLAVFGHDMVKNIPGVQVAFDCKCSQVLSTLLTQWGAQYAVAPTGHAFVKQKMVDTHALLAGELSCHFMFKDRYFGYDDGIYAMMRLFEIIDHNKQSLHELVVTFPKSYTTGEVRIPCNESAKDAIVQSVQGAFRDRTDVELSTLDGIRVETAYGWGIVRASNTQPVISFSCESMTPEGFERIKKDFCSALEPSVCKKMLQRSEVFE